MLHRGGHQRGGVGFAGDVQEKGKLAPKKKLVREPGCLREKSVFAGE